MCDYILPTYLPVKIPAITRFTFAKTLPSFISKHRYASSERLTNGCLQFAGSRFESFVVRVSSPTSTNSRSSGSEDRELFGELEFDQRRPETQFEEQMLKTAIDDDLVEASGGLDSDDSVGLKIKESAEQLNLRRGRQLMRRFNLIAKQVVSLHSALSLGFVSQLWVDTNSWMVSIIEVRPSLLSGEFERFLLDDITQVGDVVLIDDENVTENENKMVGLDTLVGYNVVTAGRRNLGKVRGFSFNINSGAVESLELDSFGISIIPSSLVSTYALFVEDVLQVVSDTVVVHEAAASRIQRLTKGIWNDQKKMGRNSIDEAEEYETEAAESDYGRERKRRSSKRKSRSKIRDTPDEWELPMDYL